MPLEFDDQQTAAPSGLVFDDEQPTSQSTTAKVLNAVKNFGTRFIAEDSAGLDERAKRKRQEGYDRANAAGQQMVDAQTNQLSDAERTLQDQARQAQQAYQDSRNSISNKTVDLIRDQGLGFTKGAANTAVKLPLAISGVAEDATGTRAALESVGYRSKDALGVVDQFGNWLDSLKSDSGQQRDKQYNATRGAAATLLELGASPSMVMDKVSESLFGVGAIGKTAGAAVAQAMPKLIASAKAKGLTGAAAEEFIANSATKIAQVAAPVSEGVQSGLDIAGTAQQHGRTLDQYGMPALAAAASTAAIGYGSNKLGAKAGIGDIETDIALRGTGATTAKTGPGGVMERVIKEGAKEGLVEEAPQSFGETASENIAMGRPWDQGIGKSVATGAATGGAMGGAHASITKHGEPSAQPVQTPPAPVAPTPDRPNSGAASPSSQQAPVLSAKVPDTSDAEKALLKPVALTALDRVNEIDKESAQRNDRLAELNDPAKGYGPMFDQERTELAAQQQALETERAGLAKDWPKSVPGLPSSFTTEAGARVAAKYSLMDAGDLITSHDENLRKNPLYPSELQPRERDRAASEMQVSGIVQKLDPARLGLSADAANGAPIVGADGLVESGNARTIALKRVYQANGQKAADYKTFLRDNAAQFGITPESVDGMANPVLVRVRSTPVNRAEFARQANASTVAAMAPSEQAKSDSNRIDTMEDLAPDENGDFSNAASRPFVQRFMARLPMTEQAGMVDASGNLSTSGYARVRNAVLAKAYGDSPVLARMTESMDDNLRNVSRAMMMAAPKVAQMRGAVAAGSRFDADITPDLMAAVEELSRLKGDGGSVQDALAQTDLMGEQRTPEARQLLQFLSENMRRPRRMADFISAYMDALDAAGDPNQGSLLGDTQAPAKSDLLTAAGKATQNEVQDGGPKSAGTDPETSTQTRRQSEDAQSGGGGTQADGGGQRPQAATDDGGQPGKRGVSARADNDADFKDALADLGQIMSKHTRVMMLPEDTPNLMPTLVKLMTASIKKGIYELSDLIKSVKEALKTNEEFKTKWNRIANATYKKAAMQALEDVEAAGQAEMFGQPVAGADRSALFGETSGAAAPAPEVGSAAMRSELDNLGQAQQAAGKAFADATPQAHRSEADRIEKVVTGLGKFPDIKSLYATLAESHRLAADRKERGQGRKVDEAEAPQIAVQAAEIPDAANTPAAILDAETSLWSRITDGAATVDEFKAGFERWVSSKADILAALAKNKKDDLLKMGGSMFAYRNKSETKPEIVEALWLDGVGQYALGRSVSYTMGSGSYEKSIRALVENTDAEQLAQYAKDRKSAQEEAVARVAKTAAAIKDPQTLTDFQTWMRATMNTGKTFKEARLELTPAQRAQYDDLAATASRAERSTRKESQQEAILRAPGEAVTATEIIKTRHTKHGHDLWQFNLDQRVSGDEFKSLVAQAKRLGGDYSSYRGGGAIPGWQFRTEDAAKAFKALIAGDTAAAKGVMQERRDSFADDRSQSATERLNEMADRLDERADASLGQERKANTDKRARQAASAEAAANSDKALAKTMRNIAQAIADNSAKFLDRVRQKTQVEALHGYVATARGEELRTKYASYADQEKHRGEAPTAETADFAEFPTFSAYRSDLATLARQLLEVDGTKLLGQRLLKEADDVTDAYTAFAKANFGKVAAFSSKGGGVAAFGTRADAEASIARSGYKGKAIAYQVKRGEHAVILSPSEAVERGIWHGDGDKRLTLHPDLGAELVEKIGKAARRGAKVSVPWQLETAHDRRKALARMGIETPAEFRAALREFIGLREQAAAPDKVKQLERAMVGRRNDGMDFFPTPESVADEMVATAGIESGMAVLEPSAGWGHIAERIRAAGVDPDVGEMSNDRRELLEAKGFNVVSSDFMALAKDDLPNGAGYDRIVMNPPFSDGRDIQHVQHAYTLLKPGGRIVAIMGESAFTNQNKRATEFREWLESVGGTEEKLAEGSFNDPTLPVNTGANARMVVIDRAPVQDGVMFSREQNTGLQKFKEADELFALPKSTAKDLEQIAKDNDAEVVIRTTNFPGGETMHTLTFDDGTAIRITDRKASPYGQDKQVYAMELVDGESKVMQLGRPGENPEDVAPTDDVWLDVSDNTPAKWGAKAYNIAMTYAHNNGRIFIGDPNGLKDKALRRRTEQMISSALKFGTTEHLAPHPRQVAGDSALGVPPLRWVYGDHIGNIERMIDVSLESLDNGAPGAKDDTRYDADTGEFTDKGGKVVPRKSSMGRDMAAYRAGIDQAQAGWRTLARTAFLRSFVGPNGKAEGSGLLDRAGDHVARISSNGVGGGAYPATERIFYSRGGGGSSLSVKSAQDIADSIKARWVNSPEIVVAANMADPAIPQAVRDYDQNQKSLGATGEPEGFIHGGKVYLVADQLATPSDVVRVLFHESLGHLGLRGVFGEALTPILKGIILARQSEVAAKAKQYGLDMGKEADRLVAAEEVLAEMAQSKPELAFVKRAIAAVRNWLRTSVPGFSGMKMTDADIVQQFILPARAFIERGKIGKLRAGGVALSRGGAAGPEVDVVAPGQLLETADARADKIIMAPTAGTAQPLDVIAKTLTKITGLERLTSGIYEKAGFMLDRHVPERIKAGLVSDFGVPEAVIDQRSMMQGRQRVQLRKVGALVDKLSSLTREESRVAYAWMNEVEPDAADELMKGLPEASVVVLKEVQQMIDRLSKEAVRMGQLTPEAYERNRFAYLRRSYAKYTLAQTASEKAGRARAISILGDQYKGRGLTESATMAQIQNAAPEWWARKLVAGKADTSLKGEKFLRLERRAPSGERTKPLEGMEGKQTGKLKEVHYFPAGEPLPAKYADWTPAGTFEARDTKGANVILWRDFTKDERENMGEIDEARFAIAKTLHAMIHDVEVGRYLEWLATNQAKKEGETIPGVVVNASERYADTFKPGEWVKVPESKIEGTSVLKYGKLAGRYLPGPVWNDLRQTVNGQFKPFGDTYAKILALWKTSKTALSPAVHMNNIMSNVVMADWHDITAGHTAKALRIILGAHDLSGTGALGRVGNLAAKTIGAKDRETAREVLNRYLDSGGNIGSWATNEVASKQIEPLLAAMEKELAATGGASAQAQVGVMAALQHALMLRLPSAWEAVKGSNPGQVVGTEAATMIELYQNEDEVFRLASWLKAKEEGKTDMEAGKIARKSFMDYNINAPWVQAARNSALPFVSYSYRAVPMMLEIAAKKPHKLMKLMLMAGALNALGVMLAGGDDDKERKLLPEEKAGRIWGLVPKLIRMPWNDKNASPVYLDIRRFIPVGDVLDVGANHAAVPMLPMVTPGGPLVIMGEVVLNKTGFTGKPITLETDTALQQTAKVMDYLFKAAAPNVLGLPGTYASTGVYNAANGKTDAFGREQSVAQAVASSFGVKLGSYPADVMRKNEHGKAQAQIMEIDRNISLLKRQLQNHSINNEEFQDKVKIEQDKKRKVQEALAKKLGG